MPERKDNRRVTDMLEKMKIIKLKADPGESAVGDGYGDPPAKPEPPHPDRVADFFAAPTTLTPGHTPSQPASVWDEEPVQGPDVNRLTDVRELYSLLGMPTGGPSTVYLLEEYMKTLPDSLPAESRRAIIIKLVAAAGFDFDKLLGDGVDRVTKLTEHASAFSARTDEVVSRYNSEIEVLERQILSIQNVIEERKNLHKKQFLAIETEAKRLREVLDFITK